MWWGDTSVEKVVALGHWLFKLFFFVHAVVWPSGAEIYCQKPLFFVSPCTISRMYLKVDL